MLPALSGKNVTIVTNLTTNSWKALDKLIFACYNQFRCFTICGRGGIGIRARLRGVFCKEYGFKSRRPHSTPGETPGDFLILTRL